MPKEFIPLSIRINDATKKLRDAGFVVVNTEDNKIAILAERKKIICKDYDEFFNLSVELTQKPNF